MTERYVTIPAGALGNRESVHVVIDADGKVFVRELERYRKGRLRQMLTSETPLPDYVAEEVLRFVEGGAL
jgi:hypothetical protein